MPDIDWERVRKGVEREHGTMIWRPYGVPTMLSPGGSSYFDAELSPRWDVPDRLIISAALTGAFFTREQNPNQPITPAEIVDQGRRCIEAGASTLHVHVRDGRGYNALSADLFAEVVVPLKQEYPDLMVDGCLVPSLEGEWDEMLRVLDSGLLDASPVNVTATYVGESLFAKPVPVILQKTRELLERGVKPEIATYTDADVNNAERWLFRSGLLEPGACWVVLAALPGCSPMGNPRQMVEGLLHLTSAIRDVDPEALIVVPAAGRASMWLATAAAALGLHIRVGMEDTIWMWPHRDDLVPDNPTMVRLAVELAEVLGREVATPAEYRKLLALERHEPGDRMSAAEFDVGHVAEQFRMPVELGKVREYARATRAQDPVYLETDDPPSPPTFLVNALFWQERRHSGWGDRPPDFQRVLHGEQEFVFHGEPPRAGTVLQGRARLERAYEKEGRRGGAMTIVEIVTEFRDASGQLVAEAISTSIETSVATA